MIIEWADNHEGFVALCYFLATLLYLLVTFCLFLSAKKANTLARKNVEIAAVAAKLSSLPTLIEYTKEKIKSSLELNEPPATVAPLLKRLGSYEADLMNLYNSLSKAANTNPVTD